LCSTRASANVSIEAAKSHADLVFLSRQYRRRRKMLLLERIKG